MSEADLSMWLRRALSEPHPLTKYRWRSGRPIALGKNMVNPNNMASYEVRARLDFPWCVCVCGCCETDATQESIGCQRRIASLPGVPSLDSLETAPDAFPLLACL